MHNTAPPRLNAAFGLSCSPRQGNSDAAAAAFSQGFTAAGGRMDLLQLKEHRVLPCVSCDACQRFAPAAAVRHGTTGDMGMPVLAGRASRICPLAAQDDSTELFARLYTAQALFLAAPIYFYHLPALLKAFIDRAQAFWMLGTQNDAVINGLPRRPAWLVLIAGRAEGDRLFEGSLLTLRYFFDIFNFELQEPLLLRGFDQSTDLARMPAVVEGVHRYGAQAAESMRG